MFLCNTQISKSVMSHRSCWIKEVTLLCNSWARNLAPVFHLVQNISEKYYHCLYLSIDQVWKVNELWFKRYSKMHPVWCTNTHHDVKDLVNHGMVKKIKAWNKKNINLCLRWHILRSYHFLEEVTIKYVWPFVTTMY